MFFLPISKDFIMFLLLSLPIEDQNNSLKSNYTLEKLSQVNNDFGLTFFGLLSVDNNNDVICPLSVLCAMSMLYNGADGETATELKQVLGFKKNNVTDLEINEGFKTILKQINSYNKNLKANYQLNVANRLMVQKEFRVLSGFWNSMKNYFYADIQSVDFENEGQTAVNEINQWIKTKTNDKIEKFFDEPFDPSTRLVILNAVYFKGDWVNPFSPTDTYDDKFFNDGFNETQVKMMSKLSKTWNYASNDDLDSDLLELPYKGEDLSLVIILPRKRNGLQNLKLALNPEKLNSAINELKLNAVNVYLPKFKIQQKYELKSALSKSLILKAFSNEADLSRINGQKNLKVSKVCHQVVIEVNERGSEAAAVTSIQIELLSFRTDRKIFKADHPFLYLIRNKNDNLILFIGQMNRLEKTGDN